MQALLSYDQSPPIAAPFRFFLTAPVFAILAGVLTAGLYGFITVYLKQHQIVTGTAINILALGLTVIRAR